MSSSTPRLISEYGGCSEVMGAMVCARRICLTSKFDTPIQRTLPCRLQRSKDGPPFFQFRRIRIWRPVNLIQINCVPPQAAQAVFDSA